MVQVFGDMVNGVWINQIILDIFDRIVNILWIVEPSNGFGLNVS